MKVKMYGSIQVLLSWCLCLILFGVWINCYDIYLGGIEWNSSRVQIIIVLCDVFNIFGSARGFYIKIMIIIHRIVWAKQNTILKIKLVKRTAESIITLTKRWHFQLSCHHNGDNNIIIIVYRVFQVYLINALTFFDKYCNTLHRFWNFVEK